MGEPAPQISASPVTERPKLALVPAPAPVVPVPPRAQVAKKAGFSIGTKFLTLILASLAIAVSAVVLNATNLFQKDNLNNIYVASDLLSAAKAGEVRAWMDSLVQKGALAGKLLSEAPAGPQKEGTKIAATFVGESDILAVELDVNPDVKSDLTAFHRRSGWINQSLSAANSLSVTALDRIIGETKLNYAKPAAGAVDLSTLVLPNGQAILFLSLPFSEAAPGLFNGIVTVVAREQKLMDSFAEGGGYSLALVDGEGKLLAHSDPTQVRERKSLADLPIVRAMRESQLDREFQEFSVNGERYLGSYAKVGIAGIAVVSQIPRASAFEAGQTLVRRSILSSLIVLSAAFIVAYLFAQTLVAPIQRLSGAMAEIARGNFTVRVAAQTRDEIGLLSDGFNSMSGEIIRLMAETADKARMEKELETAKIVQDTMFPPAEIVLPTLEIQSYYTPAGECGGDWWGMIELPDGNVLLAVGDATGHGVPAALVTATAKATCSVIHRIAQDHPDVAQSPSHILHILNKAVYESTLGKILMTFFVAVVNPRTGEVTYATASHDPIYWYKTPADATPENGKKDHLTALLSPPGPRLGQGPEARYENGKVTMNPSDFLVLYTDGVTEGRNPAGEEYGERKFLRSIGKHAHRSPKEARDLILADFNGFVDGQPIHDDVTLVVCKFGGAKA